MPEETEKDLERNPKAELDEDQLDEVSGGRSPLTVEQGHAQDEERLIGGQGVQPDQLPHP
jgi:hypothetical protein